jgi:glycogen debranching enzyme
MRYGFVEEAHRIIVGLLDAATHFGGRLPELFCGFDRGQYAEPVVYPASCSPQAWAAAAPFLLLRSMLRIDPSVPTGELWIAPAIPPEFGDVHLVNVPFAGTRVSLDVVDDDTTLTGLPDRITLHTAARGASRA